MGPLEPGAVDSDAEFRHNVVWRPARSHAEAELWPAPPVVYSADHGQTRDEALADLSRMPRSEDREITFYLFVQQVVG